MDRRTLCAETSLATFGTQGSRQVHLDSAMGSA